jgi:hypothetical protein
MKEKSIFIFVLMFLLLANSFILAEENITNSSEEDNATLDANITVTGTVEEIIEIKIDFFQEYIKTVNSEISNLSEFCQEQVKSIINLSELDNEIEKIKQDYLNASTKEEYLLILGNLSEFDILISVYKSREAKSITLYPSIDKINLGILKKIGGGDYNEDRKDEYFDAIILWNQENVITKFNFSEITKSYYKGYEESILKIFELDIQKFGETVNKSYLILREMDNLQFKEDYQEKKESGYVYIDLSEIDGTITFSTTEDINFDELPAFISPGIDSLSLIEEPSKFKEEKRWGLFIGIMAALIIIATIIYIILHRWYEKRYEMYLFKDEESFLNILSYIENSKKIGKSDKEIILKLKESGWNSEQIRYAIKKYRKNKEGMLSQTFEDKEVDEVLNNISEEKNKEVENKNLKKEEIKIPKIKENIPKIKENIPKIKEDVPKLPKDISSKKDEFKKV